MTTPVGRITFEKRGLGDIAVLRAEQLREFIEYIAALAETGVYELRFAIDDGLKVKVNNQTWSIPLGKIER